MVRFFRSGQQLFFSYNIDNRAFDNVLVDEGEILSTFA